MNKKHIHRGDLPPRQNTLLSVTEHCLKSRNYVNGIRLERIKMTMGHGTAEKQCRQALVCGWASMNDGKEPD